ncbi:hypothetical protein FGKAn22_03820 [Ferrigenium kumadai]|uniref:Uncharacterized protein n=1 Tax=Ferrigenium kumadai TaxID=1682490 RepID=A0AAN1VYX8_9PROT|nr:hypothetical protein [Ferrigenium kumadai]BBI98689.1 hypothetical protein FGKAn22_03820 [Ferrigenium kumadai]
MAADWVYPEVTPYQVQGRDLSEDNFAQEDRTSLEILMREVLQNPLDARASDNAGPVRVTLKILQPGNFDADYLASLLGGEYSKRLEASGGEPLPDLAMSSVLVIEDFGTTGLQGRWDDQNADGPEENWNAFWFREGEGAKSATGSNGRAGQGKITYYRIGAARAVFGFTVRKSDGQRLLMGRSAFRRVYPYGGSKFNRHSFWCCGSEQPLPVTDDEEITAFQDAFGLSRKSEPGLSLVIPFPAGFDPKEAVRTLISDFYYPIACGNLELSLASMDIDSSNVDTIAVREFSDETAYKRKSSFTKGFRNLVRSAIDAKNNGDKFVELKPGWDKTPTLKEDSLPEGALETLRAAMENGKRISVRCPVTVRPRKTELIQTWFDVHIEIPEDLARAEEAYIRRDLLIGSESHLAASAYLQKARALTIISDSNLSAFLADAEEPTHLKWNGSRPRLAEDYLNPQATLRAVRNAAPRLLALVSNGMVRRDMKALAKYFTRHTDEGKRHAAGGNVKPGGGTPPNPDITAPKVRKPVKIVTGTDRVRVLPNGSSALTAEGLPISCGLELAYEGLDQDPFKAYDPFDFDLADESVHQVTTSGATITGRQGNRINFDITEPEFVLEVPGFDPNIRLRARLNYTEKSNGTSVSEE